MPDPRDSELLIGVDGGASEVKAHEVLVLSESPASPGSIESGGRGGEVRFVPTLALGAASASCCYDHAPGFEPTALVEQLRAFAERRIAPTNLEIAQGDLWIDAFANTIGAIASESAGESSRGSNRTLVRLGICLPGLKTSDGRGLAVVRNGPRIPDFLDRLEKRLRQDGLVVAHPIARLLSDGDACGIGERAHAQGMLRGATNAYYIGGGTGLAETMLLAGEIVSFDALGGWLKKAWALECEAGESFEERISMGGINAAYARRSGKPLPMREDEYPEQRALRGDGIAMEVLRTAAEALADLIYARLSMLSKGRKPATPLPVRAIVAGASAASLHMRPHTYLDRIVFGQRLAHLFADEDMHALFRDVVETRLAQRIQSSRDEKLAAHYLEGTSLRANFLCASSLRSAPALGAAAWALEDRVRGAQRKLRARTGAEEVSG
jgi:predicted NBD/HSP70 family sugar kinase